MPVWKFDKDLWFPYSQKSESNSTSWGILSALSTPRQLDEITTSISPWKMIRIAKLTKLTDWYNRSDRLRYAGYGHSRVFWGFFVVVVWNWFNLYKNNIIWNSMGIELSFHNCSIKDQNKDLLQKVDRKSSYKKPLVLKWTWH